MIKFGFSMRCILFSFLLNITSLVAQENNYREQLSNLLENSESIPKVYLKGLDQEGLSL